MNESGGHKDKNCKLLRKLTKLQRLFCYETHICKSKKCFSMFSFRNLFNGTFSTAQIYTETVRGKMKHEKHEHGCYLNYITITTPS
jgi:hypothetical protein